MLFVNTVDYGDLKIEGGGEFGRLWFKLSNGDWGYVCSSGFDYSAAKVACKELGYNSGTYYASK